MSEPFRKLQLFYPPHPALTWTPRNLLAHHRGIPGFVAQLKYDDWRTLICFLPGGKIELYSRKKAKLPRYRPTAGLIAGLKALRLSDKRYHVIDGGLLHYKTPRVRNTLVLWDILVHDSTYLSGTTYRHRYELLREICHHPERPVKLSAEGESVVVGLEISKNLWLAPSFRSGFKELFERASRLPEIEGIVLKDTRAPLVRAFRMTNNASWQIRVRRPRIDYPF